MQTFWLQIRWHIFPLSLILQFDMLLMPWIWQWRLNMNLFHNSRPLKILRHLVTSKTINMKNISCKKHNLMTYPCAPSKKKISHHLNISIYSFILVSKLINQTQIKKQASSINRPTQFNTHAWSNDQHSQVDIHTILSQHSCSRFVCYFKWEILEDMAILMTMMTFERDVFIIQRFGPCRVMVD